MALTKAALIQFSGALEKEKNIEKARTYVAQAAGEGANIVCLQELFNTTYFCYTEDPEFWSFAEPIPGPTIEAMSELAKKHRIVLVAPIYEKAIKGELYNTAVVLGPDGEIMGKYRKSSIPLVKTASLVGNEKYYFKPGNTGFPVWQTPWGVNIGVMICYDRHFPEHARLLALNGADLVFVPTATCGMSRYLWEIELQAHAIDISQTVIDHNREILPEVQFELVTPGAPTPFPDNYFDVIFSSEVIEHLYDVDFVFNEFSRMLKPGGRLILTTPYHGVLKNLVIALFYFEQHYSLTWQHIRFYTKKSLGNMCRSHGLNPISWKSVGRVPFLARSFFLTCEKMS